MYLSGSDSLASVASSCHASGNESSTVHQQCIRRVPVHMENLGSPLHASCRKLVKNYHHSYSIPTHTHRDHIKSLSLLYQFRTQPHLGCCLAASAICMHLCTNSANPTALQQHMRSCNDVKGSYANRCSRLTTVVAGHEKSRWASSSAGRSCIPKTAHRLQPRSNQTTP
jgi:hypothetical protein